MKPKYKINIAGLVILFVVFILSADAQSVIHLGTGDSYLFSQPSFVRGQIDEGGGDYFLVQLGFTGDLFTLGDSLRVDVLASPTSLTPLTTGTASNPPWIIAGQINFSWIGSPWDTAHGAVRLTMLTGSVDVASVLGISASQFIQRTYSFPVPEPSSLLLLLFTSAAIGGVRWINRRAKHV